MVSRVSRGMRVESAAARVGADRSGARFQNRATQTRESDVWKPAGSETRGTEAGNARGALGRGTYVSEKDFLVFLCRLETAIRAASCGGGRIGEVRAGRSALRTFGKSDIRVDNVERGQKPKFFRAKRSRRRRRGAASTYLRVVGVLGGHRRGGLRGELIQLAGGDALVDSRGDFLCHEYLRSEKQDEKPDKWRARCRFRSVSDAFGGRIPGTGGVVPREYP